MQRVPNRNITLLLSICGVALFCYFLLSPVLLLPADPHFGRLTIGRPLIQIDGESWIPIYGLQLMMKTGLENMMLLALFMLTTFVSLCLSPFIAFMRKKTLLVFVAISAILNLLVLGAVVIAFFSYLEVTGLTSGLIAMLMLLTALFFRRRALKSTEGKIDEPV